MNLKKRKL